MLTVTSGQFRDPVSVIVLEEPDDRSPHDVSGLVQRLVQVRNQIVDVLDTDRQTNHVRGDAG